MTRGETDVSSHLLLAGPRCTRFRAMRLDKSGVACTALACVGAGACVRTSAARRPQAAIHGGANTTTRRQALPREAKLRLLLVRGSLGAQLARQKFAGGYRECVEK